MKYAAPVDADGDSMQRVVERQPTVGPTGVSVQGTAEVPTASFVLSLIGGLLILAGALMTMMFSYGFPYYGMMGGYYGSPGGYYGMMQGFGYGGWFYGITALAAIAGIAVLVGAAMIYTRPGKASTWGLVVLVFSALGFLGVGGFFIGAILGVIGGILAMAWRPSVTRSDARSLDSDKQRVPT